MSFPLLLPDVMIIAFAQVIVQEQATVLRPPTP
jgi:hypothetical protein